MQNVAISSLPVGVTTIVPGIVGMKIRVHRYHVVASGTLVALFTDTAAELTGPMTMIAGVPHSAGGKKGWVFEGQPGQPIKINNSSGSATISGHLSFSYVPAPTPALTSGVGASYVTFVGQPPIANHYITLDLFTWIDQLVAIRINDVPKSRATEYYFDPAGSDANNGLSPATPKQTLAAAQTLLTAAGTTGNIRLRFRRGRVFTSTQLITIRDHITVDDYGTGAKPIWRRFVTAIAAGVGWTSSSGAYFTAMATEMTWIRETIDKNKMYTKADSIANCRLTDNSFFWDDATDRLYIRYGAGNNPNTIDWEGTTGSDAGYHVDCLGDDIRIENIVTEGFGMRLSPGVVQTYGFALRPGAGKSSVCIGCECRYTGYHAMGHLDGGRATFKDCIVGMTRSMTGGVTNYVTYNASGGQETLFVNCWSETGNLFETNIGRVALHIYGHTNGGVGEHPALVFVWGGGITPGPMSCAQNSYINNSVPTNNSLANVRSFIIEESCDDSAQVEPFNTFVNATPSDQVQINCTYKTNVGPLGTTFAGASGAGWSINCTFKIETDHVSGYRSSFDSVSNGGEFINCHLVHGGYGAIFKRATDAANWANKVVINCIVSCDNAVAPDQSVPNLVNANNPSVHHNAWWTIDPVVAGANTAPAGTGGVGTIGDPFKVTLAALPVVDAAPTAASPLYNAGDPTRQPAFDKNRTPRGSKATIGPITGS